MTALTPENREIQVEDVKANGSISEGFLLKIGAMSNWLRANCGDYVGKKEEAALTEAQFAAKKKYSLSVPEAQKKWVLMKGQDITGSKYHQETGVSILPNMVGNGAHSEQAQSGAPLLQYFQNQNKAHTHAGRTPYRKEGYPGAPTMLSQALTNTIGGTIASCDVIIDNSGGDVARPNSVTFNFFLRIND